MIKHTIRREPDPPRKPDTPQRGLPAQNAPPIARPAPDAIAILNDDSLRSADAYRAEQMLRGGGARLLQTVVDAYGGKPVDVRFGSMVISIEVYGAPKTRGKK
jgi:hypothetical protein